MSPLKRFHCSSIDDGPLSCFQGRSSIDDGPLSCFQGRSSIDDGPLSCFQGISPIDDGPLSCFQGRSSIDDGPLSCFQGISSSASSFHASLPQAVDGVMSLDLYPQVVSLVRAALPASLSALSFPFIPACPGQYTNRSFRRWMSTIDTF